MRRRLADPEEQEFKMKTLKPDYQSSRHPRTEVTQRRHAGLTALLAALLLCGTSIQTAQADPLGRLFFTPAQRQQMDFAYARNTSADSNSSAILTVNGIVQKNGGARTVWVNGMSQNMDNRSERNPVAQSVNIPGKQQPVKLKVGDKILLDQAAPATQDATSE